LGYNRIGGIKNMPTPPELSAEYKKARENKEIVRINGVEIYYPDFGESIKIFKSGWENLFCVVWESGPDDTCDVLLKGAEEIKKLFGIDIKEYVNGIPKT
jgi:hypothetical protein